ncbi:MAG TPA: PorV/PorQ family protein [bacterium]|nr:PorV/PorQ family protein [bacterium]HOX85503.1 PorV/PorQ family protein [bacterium]HPG44662.1 PorV/PorQ family protein [bacterium]HPM99431.1 PorV/PorQ family protein [bacterium]
MKSSICARVLGVIFSLCLPIMALGQANEGIGYHGAQFLKISPAARQVAMGEAFTGLADDINLMRYNLGGLGNLHKIQLAANFHNWIEDTQQGSVGFALPFRFGVLGMDLTFFDEGDIVEIDEEFNPTGGTSGSDDILLSLGFGQFVQIGKFNIGLGIGAKMLRQNLVGYTNTSYGIDLGLQYRLKHITLGAAMQNLGIKDVSIGEMESPMPEMYRAGTAFRLPIGEAFKFNITADAVWPRDEKMRYYTGAEMVVGDLLALRGGYKIHEIEASRWAVGFGLFIPMEWLANSQTRLDYSYAPLEAFEETSHRFSMLFTFGVLQRVMALNYQDRENFDAMNAQLREELEAAEKARLAAQQAEERTRLLEEEIAQRLARIQKIAQQSEGKIEVEPKDANKILVSLRINFDFDKANIRREEFPTMRQVGEILNTYPEAMVHISGHTDSIGTLQYNINLSQRRMDSVMVYLAKKENVSNERFYMPVGYGEMRPVADNGTSQGRFRNRRVEFLLYTMDSTPEMPEGSAIKNITILDDRTVQIVCNGTVRYRSSQLSNPERLILDFDKIFLLTDKTTWEINRGPFVRARVGYHPDKQFSRVVFDLRRPVKVEIDGKGNIITVRVK